MNKNFNEMSFDELKCYRREGLWGSLGLLLVIILVITGMVLMEVNHDSPSNQNRFRVIGLTTVIALICYLMIGVGFTSLYKPQVQQTNVQDQIDIIQMDNELEREQKVDQVLDTITPEDKKSE